MHAVRCAAVTLTLAALTGCITDPVTGKSVMGMPTSDAEEEQMGESYRPQILAQFSGAYPDRDVQSYLSSIVVGMGKKSVRPDLTWSFTVVNSSEVNAFAVPGGELFITRGLLWRLDDEAEFAVVMGHEVGHVEHRHSVQGMFRDSLTATLIQIAADRAKLGSLAGLGQTLVLSKFSRDQEREADVRGVHNSYQAGYDPRRGAEVFRKFLALKNNQESAVEGWTSDHPLDGERIENIERLSAEADPRLAGDAPVANLRVQTGRFAEILAKLRGDEKVYDRHDKALAAVQQAGTTKEAVARAIPELEACAKALPGHAFFANTLGRAYAVTGDTARAETWLKRAADMRQGLVDPDLLLGQIALSKKDWKGADAHAERALEILPGNYPSFYVRGEAALGMGRTDDARTWFQAVLQSAPPESREYQAAAEHLGQGAPQR